jgi:hypothetical protein
LKVLYLVAAETIEPTGKVNGREDHARRPHYPLRRPNRHHQLTRSRSGAHEIGWYRSDLPLGRAIKARGPWSANIFGGCNLPLRPTEANAQRQPIWGAEG